MFSHRYGLEHISCVGVTDVIQGLANIRKVSRGDDGKNTWSGVITRRIHSSLCCSYFSVLQNVRGGSQVRSRLYFVK